MQNFFVSGLFSVKKYQVGEKSQHFHSLFSIMLDSICKNKTINSSLIDYDLVSILL